MKKFKIKIHPVTKHSQGLFKDIIETLEADERQKAVAYAKEMITVLEGRYGRLTYSIEEI